ALHGVQLGVGVREPLVRLDEPPVRDLEALRVLELLVDEWLLAEHGDHVVEGRDERPELVLAREGDARAQGSGPDPLDAALELDDRGDDPTLERLVEDEPDGDSARGDEHEGAGERAPEDPAGALEREREPERAAEVARLPQRSGEDDDRLARGTPFVG